MKKNVIKSSIALFLLLATIAEARPVYDFALKDLDGNTVKLSNFKGKVILLDFWATWCKPCQAAMPFLVSLHKKYGDKGFVLIGVNVDRRKGPDKVQKFLEAYNIDYLNVLFDGTVMRRYRVNAMPTTVLIDRDFNEVKRFVGFRPEAEIELEKKISELLSNGGAEVSLCLGVIKVIGESSEGGLGDRTRRLIYKSLEKDNRNFRVGFTIPGEKPEDPCNYQIDGSLSVNGDNGRLTVSLYDGESGMEVHSATVFGQLENLPLLSQQVTIQLTEAIRGY